MQIRRPYLVGVVLALVLVGFGAASSAAPIIYTDRAAWEAAISGVTTETYDTYGWVADHALVINGSIDVGGITYTAPGRLAAVPASGGAAYHTSAYIEWQNPASLTIDLPTLVRAVAFDIGEYRGGVGTYGVTLGNGDVADITGILNAYKFFGIVTDTSFDTIQLTSSVLFPTLDNLSYEVEASPVPEPASLILFGSGLIALASRRRRA